MVSHGKKQCTSDLTPFLGTHRGESLTVGVITSYEGAHWQLFPGHLPAMDWRLLCHISKLWEKTDAAGEPHLVPMNNFYFTYA